MRALKPFVATAVIVFTLTTVAMAGVQHMSQRDRAADDRSRRLPRRGRRTRCGSPNVARAVCRGPGQARRDGEAHRQHQRQKARTHKTRHESAHEQATHAVRATVHSPPARATTMSSERTTPAQRLSRLGQHGAARVTTATTARDATEAAAWARRPAAHRAAGTSPSSNA